MKNLIIYSIVAVAIALIYWAGYTTGRHYQCKDIDLYNSYQFRCDGVVIQGPVGYKQHITNSWVFSKN